MVTSQVTCRAVELFDVLESYVSKACEERDASHGLAHMTLVTVKSVALTIMCYAQIGAEKAAAAAANLNDTREEQQRHQDDESEGLPFLPPHVRQPHHVEVILSAVLGENSDASAEGPHNKLVGTVRRIAAFNQQYLSGPTPASVEDVMPALSKVYAAIVSSSREFGNNEERSGEEAQSASKMVSASSRCRVFSSSLLCLLELWATFVAVYVTAAQLFNDPTDLAMLRQFITCGRRKGQQGGGELENDESNNASRNNEKHSDTYCCTCVSHEAENKQGTGTKKKEYRSSASIVHDLVRTRRASLALCESLEVLARVIDTAYKQEDETMTEEEKTRNKQKTEEEKDKQQRCSSFITQAPLPLSADSFRTCLARVLVVGMLHDVNDHKYEKPDGSLSKGLETFVRSNLCKRAPSSTCTSENYSKMLFPRRSRDGDDDDDGEKQASAIMAAISAISYSKEKKQGMRYFEKTLGEEWTFVRDVCSDADKLEAIGRAGLYRCWAFSIEMKEQKLGGAEYLHNEVFANDHEGGAKEAFRQTIFQEVQDHTAEKLAILKDDFMVTVPGKRIAASEHDEMLDLLAEWRRTGPPRV